MLGAEVQPDKIKPKDSNINLFLQFGVVGHHATGATGIDQHLTSLVALE
jgi:hypothetical protein